MQDSWVGLALPLVMIGFWAAVGIRDLILAPTPPQDTTYRSNRVMDTTDINRPICG